MDVQLLRVWLQLPPGPWPPDHYTLLAISAGHADLATFEPRVLQRMDLLRRHQLLHPELVTEGMNRLAQALITLTDPVSKTAYDSQLGFAPAPAIITVPIHTPVPEPEPAHVVVAEPVFEDEAFDAEVLPVHPTELTQEILLPEELLPAYEVLQPPDVPLRPPPPPKPVEAVVDAIPVVRPWPTPPSSRRWIYARLAIIRRLIRSWDRLRPVFLDPQDPLDRPGRVLILLEAAAGIRPHLKDLSGVVGGVNEPGGIVAAVLKQPLLLDTIRRLLPEQRQELARDCRLAQLELQDEYRRLRRLSVEERAKAEGIQHTPAILRWLRAAPELLLVAFALFIMFIAVVRSLVGRDTSP